MIIHSNCSIIYFKNRRIGELFELEFVNNLSTYEVKQTLNNIGYKNPLLLVKRDNGGYSDYIDDIVQNLSNISKNEPIQVAFTLE